MRNTLCDMGNTFCAQCCKYHVKQEATHMTYTLSCLIWARQPPITNTTRRIATISPVPMYSVHALHSGQNTKAAICADHNFTIIHVQRSTHARTTQRAHH